ncbi:Imm39 family immunity protein [Roseateles chitinivorans]|uniref:Imm39 family immunity protein n=1 Tax=Roseateles chitinivorans TaxID=2917965 RepID=UPI003D670AFF
MSDLDNKAGSAAPRCLLVGGSYLAKGRLKQSSAAALAARNGLEVRLIEAGYLDGAPFRTVSLILRYGDKEDLNPDIGSVDEVHSELPVTVMLDLAALRALDLDALTAKFTQVMADILIDVAVNFDLPYAFLEAYASD